MSLDMMDYSRLSEINRGIQTLTRRAQAQGNAATVPVETYNQLFARCEELRVQLDAALATSAHWEREARKMEASNKQWIAYADKQEAKAEIAEEKYLRALAPGHKAS